MAQVTVVFDRNREYVLEVDPGELDSLNAGAARAWLAREFDDLDITPANPMGKILIMDMILGVARYAGERRFAQPDEWTGEFARATARALDRQTIRIDVAGATVG